MNVENIQRELRAQGVDGWLFFDHHGRDPLAYRILGLGPAHHVTRRWYYLIPAYGDPVALVHRIENSKLDRLPGGKRLYASWQEHRSELQAMLTGIATLAMQYSPRCAIPSIAMVDAGTVELVRECGCQVVTSADLVQHFEATLSIESLESHKQAASLVDSVRHDAFQLIRDRIRSSAIITEMEVADFIRTQFSAVRLLTENGPTVAVDEHSGDPHYEPGVGHNSVIQKNSFLLVDMWAKVDQENSIFYDITWTGFCGEQVPDRISSVFDTVRSARDAAVARVRNAFPSSEPLRGYQIDDAARQVIEDRGFGPQFVHRTGHSISQQIHGSGANMDNFENHDERKLVPWTCFSIEPGIYLKEFGIRSELNVFLTDAEAIINGEIQDQLVRIF